MTQEIRIENLKNHPKNIRKTYGDLKELTASIKENGVLQNLIVVPDPKNEGMYLVVAGNCRLRASRKAGLETLPCNVVEMTEKEQVLTMLTENMQRNGLSIAEEAAGIQMCLEDFGMKVPEVAKATGLSASTVRSRRNIAKLDLATVKEKTVNPDFQLSITDLNSLSKVKDVDKRNVILAEATDSKNLKWKVEQAMRDEIKEKNLATLTAMLEEAGIELAENVSSSDLYGNKWDTIKSINLTYDIPASLFDDDDSESVATEGLMYLIQYNYLKIIKKHKAEKKQPTESELAERRVRKSRKEVKSLYRQMHAEMASFVQALLNGQLLQPNDPADLLIPLWSVILKKNAYTSTSSIVSIMTGKETYLLSLDEKASAYERTDSLPLYAQMMAVAVKGCAELEIMDRDGHYSDTSATILLTLYTCLNSVGFSFSNNEYDRVLNGTHELYEPWEEAAVEENAIPDDGIAEAYDENAVTDDGIREASDEDDTETVPYDENDRAADIADDDEEEIEIDSLDGFVELDNPEDNPFAAEEAEQAASIDEEYPTVYSTEDGFAPTFALSDDLVEIDEAA